MFKFLRYFTIIIFLIGANLVNAEEKIVFINVDYVFQNSSVGKKISSQIQKKSENLKLNFDKNKKEIDVEKNKLIKQKNVLSETEYVNKVKKLENDIDIFNKNIAKENNELNIFRDKVKVEFLKRLNKILQEYAKKNSLDLIIKKENILLGKNNLDISKDILDIVNKDIKSIEIN